MLFGLWHAGYVPGIGWRVAYLGGEPGVLPMLFWKVSFGLMLGLLLGAARVKAGSLCLPLWLHCMLNALGSG